MVVNSIDLDDLKKDLEEQGVRYLFSGYADMHGSLKGKIVPMTHMKNMFKGSELYTGAALDGLPQDISDEELSAHPDPAAGFVFPWDNEIAYFPSNLYCHNERFSACSRNVLDRQVDAAKDMGYTMNLGVETEFYVLKDGEDGSEAVSDRDVLAKPCYDVATAVDNFHWLLELVDAMDTLGWDVYSFDHEDAQGQFEIDFMYADARTMADRVAFFRFMANEIARKYGYFASFMPKPFADRTGSGAHFNMSLADVVTGENLFEPDGLDPKGVGLSELGVHFVAGILKHASAITLAIAPTVNSYKRLVRQGSMSGSTWAPVFVSYGNNNRTNMLRVPLAGGRVECRAVDIACNPYLGAAMILAAGLEGIREKLDPGAPHTENLHNYTDEMIAETGIAQLPNSLGEAIEAFRSDPLSKEVFGEELFNSYLEYKQGEWDSYNFHISQWERDRYLKFF